MTSAPLTLLCLPNAGGSAAMYHRWKRLLPDWLTVLPMELPGRGHLGSQPLVSDYHAMVTQLARDYLALPPGRYALFGHSMGGLLAYGLAQRLSLSVAGRSPCALLVSASAAPTCRNPVVGDLRDGALIAEMRKQGGTPEEAFASGELMQMVLPVMRADYQVCASFQHDARRQPLALPLHVFAGRSDHNTPQQMAAWRHETQASFSLHWFDGGHFYLRDATQEALLMHTIERLLHANRIERTGAAIALAGQEMV